MRSKLVKYWMLPLQQIRKWKFTKKLSLECVWWERLKNFHRKTSKLNLEFNYSTCLNVIYYFFLHLFFNAIWGISKWYYLHKYYIHRYTSRFLFAYLCNKSQTSILLYRKLKNLWADFITASHVNTEKWYQDDNQKDLFISLGFGNHHIYFSCFFTT